MLKRAGVTHCIFPNPEKPLPLVKRNFLYPSLFDLVQVSTKLWSEIKKKKKKKPFSSEICPPLLLSFTEMLLNIMFGRTCCVCYRYAQTVVK